MGGPHVERGAGDCYSIISLARSYYKRHSYILARMRELVRLGTRAASNHAYKKVLNFHAVLRPHSVSTYLLSYYAYTRSSTPPTHPNTPHLCANKSHTKTTFIFILIPQCR